MRTDPAPASAIAGWERRLLPLTALTPPVEADVWDALTAAIDPRPTRERLARPSAPARGVVRRAWESAGVWRAAAAVLLMVALGLAWRGPARPEAVATRAEPEAVATMTEPGQEDPVAVATLRDGTVSVRLLRPVAATGRLGLWALPKGEAAPRLLGLLPPGGGVLAGPDLPTGSTVMVTAEPAGVSATPGRTLFAGIVARY